MITLLFSFSAPADAHDVILGIKPDCNIKHDTVLLKQQQRSSLDLAHLAISTMGASASSFWFSSPKGISFDEFISVPEVKIRRELKRHLINNGIDDSMRVMIDLENPVHPRGFAKFRQQYGDTAFKALIAAFKLRVDIARELLPNARLGIYGLPTPTGSDVTVSILAGQTNAIQAAADLGLLDSVDDIYTTLYLRYGPDDRYHQRRIEAMTRAGIESALTLRRRDGSRPSVVPLFSYRIFNGRSANHREVAPIHLARLQLEIARSYDDIKTIAYWTGRDSDELLHWLELLSPALDSCIQSRAPTG